MNTLQNLYNFIDRRNASGFATNLQFQIDMDASDVDLGAAFKVENGYAWDTGHGILVENNKLGSGKMALYTYDRVFIYGDSRVMAPDL